MWTFFQSDFFGWAYFQEGLFLGKLFPGRPFPGVFSGRISRKVFFSRMAYLSYF